MSSDNMSRRLSSILNLDLLDPLLEAMIDGVIVPGGASVSVEFSFLPFVVDESEMDHEWHPGPMEVDNYSDEDAHNDEDKDEEEDEDDMPPLYSNDDPSYDDDYNEVRAEGSPDEIGEEENANDYSSQHEDEAEEEDDDEDEDDDDEDEDDALPGGFIDDSVRDNYGSLGYAICHNMINRKILNETFNSRFFLRQMVEHFFTHLKQEGNMVSSAALQKLLLCLPLLSELKNVISKTKYTMKEAIIVKVVLEIYENYHKCFGAPNFKVYHNEVVPLLVDFYNRLPDGALKLISKQLQRVLLNLKHWTDNFTLFYTKQEYITHYRDATRKMRNLSESTNPSLFIR